AHLLCLVVDFPHICDRRRQRQLDPTSLLFLDKSSKVHEIADCLHSILFLQESPEKLLSLEFHPPATCLPEHSIYPHRTVRLPFFAAIFGHNYEDSKESQRYT